MEKQNIGSSFEDFLNDEGIAKEVNVLAVKRTLLVDSLTFDALDRNLESNPAKNNKCLKVLLSREKRWA